MINLENFKKSSFRDVNTKPVSDEPAKKLGPNGVQEKPATQIILDDITKIYDDIAAMTKGKMKPDEIYEKLDSLFGDLAKLTKDMGDLTEEDKGAVKNQLESLKKNINGALDNLKIIIPFLAKFIESTENVVTGVFDKVEQGIISPQMNNIISNLTDIFKDLQAIFKILEDKDKDGKDQHHGSWFKGWAIASETLKILSDIAQIVSDIKPDSTKKSA
jgi:hypothetical protein